MSAAYSAVMGTIRTKTVNASTGRPSSRPPVATSSFSPRDAPAQPRSTSPAGVLATPFFGTLRKVQYAFNKGMSLFSDRRPAKPDPNQAPQNGRLILTELNAQSIESVLMVKI